MTITRIFAVAVAASACAGGLALATSVALAAPPVRGASAATEPLPSSFDIAVGEQRTLPVTGALTRVAVGDPSVADVLVVRGDRRGGLLLVGKGAGTTNVMVWESGVQRTFVVNVTTNAARALLGPGTPDVKVLGGTAIITGSAATMERHQRAVDAAEGSVGASGKGSKSGGSNGANGGKDASGGGSGDGNVLDTSTIATRAVVQVDVRVVEFSRTVLKEIGFNFYRQNNGFSFGTFSPSSVSSSSTGSSGSSISAGLPISSAFNLVFSSASHGLSADLSLMETNNLARVLAEPTLVALSGQSASFLAGGEIPVPVPQALGSTSIEYKPYGIGLSLTPTVLSPERIALKVAPEASQLDYTNAVTISGVSVPALTTRRTETTIELGDGESFVIGGLIDRETASNVNKVPLLGDLPVIGAFFKQLSYQQNERELVIVVTPHLVSPMAKGAKLPSSPGELAEQRNAPVWRALIGGAAAREPVPGFLP
ncbi:type II and III secretion system protein family protein [Paraburkholderia sp. Ac-20340]|uniref:type II and III secretion system protein family protein n=1 Tax=Paraburkholderia sp. Ac-20340 TaxID=2703888 RepID=UPI00197E7637|nr:pilus assembly protein N-terminal domain-containing protein [Paraburkholderia sp. Ac-20340]MBN3855124.1 type II and III secretion system protein family protein [Paraburkholderia sp. Ac-20340]